MSWELPHSPCQRLRVRCASPRPAPRGDALRSSSRASSPTSTRSARSMGSPRSVSTRSSRTAAGHTRGRWRRRATSRTSRPTAPSSGSACRLLPSAHSWSVGENLLWSSPGIDGARALKLWLASPEHRKNLLDPSWREIGVPPCMSAHAPGVYHGRRHDRDDRLRRPSLTLAPGRIRTSDPRIRSPLLCPLSYGRVGGGYRCRQPFSARGPLRCSGFVVAVAQLVEPRVVVPVVAGSSPVRHPGSKESGG